MGGCMVCRWGGMDLWGMRGMVFGGGVGGVVGLVVGKVVFFWVGVVEFDVVVMGVLVWVSSGGVLDVVVVVLWWCRSVVMG